MVQGRCVHGTAARWRSRRRPGKGGAPEISNVRISTSAKGLHFFLDESLSADCGRWDCGEHGAG